MLSTLVKGRFFYGLFQVLFCLVKNFVVYSLEYQGHFGSFFHAREQVIPSSTRAFCVVFIYGVDTLAFSMMAM